MMLTGDRQIVISPSDPDILSPSDSVGAGPRPASPATRARPVPARGAVPMNRVLVVLTIAVVALGLTGRAADNPPAAPPAVDSDLQKTKQSAAFEQERLRRQFSEFQQKLLALAQRYEKSRSEEHTSE